MTLRKWKINYTVEEDGILQKKTTEVYGANIFDAYCNATKILKILERNKVIEKFDIDH